jgi:hypothetical protein
MIVPGQWGASTATCLRSHPETGGRILAEDLARAYVLSERRNRFVMCLLLDDVLGNTIHRRLGNAATRKECAPMGATFMPVRAAARFRILPIESL